MIKKILKAVARLLFPEPREFDNDWLGGGK